MACLRGFVRRGHGLLLLSATPGLQCDIKGPHRLVSTAAAAAKARAQAAKVARMHGRVRPQRNPVAEQSSRQQKLKSVEDDSWAKALMAAWKEEGP
eukprot:TRINITY_DN85348_c0_g1_i1.p1 TRINITY_DN85348_c0_g1~~TRINITY_DN85348_c0_g1_i1.p1  ORF type:complete len:107 (-),score=23.11 TRINITY_DN85348_c0_g1_i1:1-288(-)